MPASIITLTTDFGVADHYVGVMKAVMLSRCPQAQLVDVSHGIPSFSILAGAYTIDQAARYFPRGTVHLIVIDPGVGTERKPLLVEAMHQVFIAPDNGVLSFIYLRDHRARIREITNRDLCLPNPSSTFHGRDVFAPAAATIAAGKVWPEDAGPLVTRPVRLSNLEPRQCSDKAWDGSVLSVDRFGNVITNFPTTRFAPLLNKGFLIAAGTGAIETFRLTFAAAPNDLCFVYGGSAGYLELGINQHDAARHLGVEAGSALRLHLPG